MKNVVSILAHEVIDPPTLHILGQSYDEALGILETSGPMSKEEREALAFAILGFIRQGEDDPRTLTQRTVEGFEAMRRRAAQRITG